MVIQKAYDQALSIAARIPKTHQSQKIELLHMMCLSRMMDEEGLGFLELIERVTELNFDEGLELFTIFCQWPTPTQNEWYI